MAPKHRSNTCDFDMSYHTFQYIFSYISEYIYGWHQDKIVCAHTSCFQLAFLWLLVYSNIIQYSPVIQYIPIIQNEKKENSLIPSLNLAEFTFAQGASSSLNLECRFCTFIELNKMGIWHFDSGTSSKVAIVFTLCHLKSPYQYPTEFCRIIITWF